MSSILCQQHTPQTPHALPHKQNTTQHHTETQTERDRERRQRERREDERGERRQDNRRQKKTGQHEREERRQKISFQCGSAWPFSVDGVFCLVKPVNARVLSKQCQVRFIFDFFQCPLAGQQFLNIFEFSILCSYSFAELFFYAATVSPRINSTYVFCGRVLSELNRIYGKPMEFEWVIFPGFTTGFSK